MNHYTDLIAINDTLVAAAQDDYSRFGTVIKHYKVISRDYAIGTNNKKYKLNRRGKALALFVGNYKVLARV